MSALEKFMQGRAFAHCEASTERGALPRRTEWESPMALYDGRPVSASAIVIYLVRYYGAGPQYVLQCLEELIERNRPDVAEAVFLNIGAEVQFPEPLPEHPIWHRLREYRQLAEVPAEVPSRCAAVAWQDSVSSV